MNQIVFKTLSSVVTIMTVFVSTFSGFVLPVDSAHAQGMRVDRGEEQTTSDSRTLDYSCTLEELDGRTLVIFEDDKIFSGREEKDSFIRATVTLEEGTYSIVAETYDGYTNRSRGLVQDNEQWFVAFEHGDADLAYTSATTDLRDDEDFVDLTETIETEFSVPAGVTSIRAQHAYYPNESTGATGANSVRPVCVAFDLVSGGAENIAPEITVLGDNPLTLEYGSEFTDPGATSSDLEDGDITADIVLGGDVIDTTTPGNYTITYNVEDSEGLAAEEKMRLVIVGEKPYTPPVTIHATKLVCEGETDLPNWSGANINIDENTAIDYVNEHETCSLTEDWDFQWGYASTDSKSGVTDPGADYRGEAPKTGDK